MGIDGSRMPESEAEWEAYHQIDDGWRPEDEAHIVQERIERENEERRQRGKSPIQSHPDAECQL